MAAAALAVAEPSRARRQTRPLDRGLEQVAWQRTPIGSGAGALTSGCLGFCASCPVKPEAFGNSCKYHI